MIVCSVVTVTARGEKDFPQKPNPPRLVNDFAAMIGVDHIQELESKLVEYSRTSSTQITIVTVNSLGDYDASDYAIQLFNKWGIGQADKDNGVLILASRDDRKIWITTGKGLEGVLTDQKTGQIYRNEMVPHFKEGDYYTGFSKAADAIIAVTKGEYKNENAGQEGKPGKGGSIGTILFIIIIIVIAISRGGGNNRGGKYMSGRGAGDIAAGFLLGSLLGGGRSSGGGSWGGGGGGGFGGFGGGSSGGGGAGGSW